MNSPLAQVIYVAAMIAIIVGLDVSLLRDRFWLRLIVNIAIVLVFAGFYWKFLRSR